MLVRASLRAGERFQEGSLSVGKRQNLGYVGDSLPAAGRGCVRGGSRSTEHVLGRLPDAGRRRLPRDRRGVVPRPRDRRLGWVPGHRGASGSSVASSEAAGRAILGLGKSASRDGSPGWRGTPMPTQPVEPRRGGVRTGFLGKRFRAQPGACLGRRRTIVPIGHWDRCRGCRARVAADEEAPVLARVPG